MRSNSLRMSAGRVTETSVWKSGGYLVCGGIGPEELAGGSDNENTLRNGAVENLPVRRIEREGDVI